MKLFISFILIILLTACGNNAPSLGGNTQQGLQSENKTALARNKQLKAEQDTIATVEVMAVANAHQAIRNLASSEAVLFQCGNLYNIFRELHYRREFLEPFIKPADICAANYAQLAIQPFNGWPDEHDVLFMEVLLLSSIATNKILTMILDDLNKQSTKLNNVEITDIIAQRFADNYSLWWDIWEQERQGYRGYTVNLTGNQPSPIHFRTNDGWDYQHGPQGAKLSYNGITWYGQGTLTGKQYILTVMDSNAVSITKGSDINSGTSSNTNSSFGAGYK